MNKALVVVDVQKAFLDPKWGTRNNKEAETNIRKLLNLWRKKGWKIIYIKHMSDDPNSIFYPENKGFDIMDIVAPEKGDEIVIKKVNSGFIGTPLESLLNRSNCEQVVITGLTTPHCISTTTRMSGNLGFETYLISDATAAFGLTDQNGVYYGPETIHTTSLATLHHEFATVLPTEEFIAQVR